MFPRFEQSKCKETLSVTKGSIRGKYWANIVIKWHCWTRWKISVHLCLQMTSALTLRYYFPRVCLSVELYDQRNVMLSKRSYARKAKRETGFVQRKKLSSKFDHEKRLWIHISLVSAFSAQLFEIFRARNFYVTKTGRSFLVHILTKINLFRAVWTLWHDGTKFQRTKMLLDLNEKDDKFLPYTLD